MTNTTTKKGAVKGTVAAAAGIAVLLGGAGTFALWNGNVTGSADDSITAGQLKISDYKEGAWADHTSGTAEPIDSIATFRMVPGDKLVRTDTASVIAEGDNLKFEANATYGDSTIASEFGGDVTVVPEVDSDSLVADGQPHDVVVTTTVTYKAEGTSGNAGQTKTVDLGAVAVSLQQVTPSQP